MIKEDEKTKRIKYLVTDDSYLFGVGTVPIEEGRVFVRVDLRLLRKAINSLENIGIKYADIGVKEKSPLFLGKNLENGHAGLFVADREVEE